MRARTTLTELRRLVRSPEHVQVTVDRICGGPWAVWAENRRTGAVLQLVAERGDYGGGLPGYYSTRERAVSAAADAERDREAVSLLATRAGRAKCCLRTGRTLA